MSKSRPNLCRTLTRNGRLVQVVQTPEEARQLRLAHTTEHDLEVVLHGSQEHAEALQESKRHHEDLMRTLSEKHGDIYLELEDVFKYHTHLFEQLKQLESLEENMIETDATFRKYGYSAHIRTRDNDVKATISKQITRASSLADGDSTNPTKKSEYRSMKFFSKPIVRQYFHKGIIWRASELQEVMSYELFVDLLYVGLIGVAGDNAAEEATFQSLVVFAVQFLMGRKIWSDIALFVAWFEAEDAVRRIAIMITLAALLGFTTNLANFRDATYIPCLCFYLVAKVMSIIHCFWYSYLLEIIRFNMFCCGAVACITIPLWLASMFVEPFNARFGLLWPALLIDCTGQYIAVAVVKLAGQVPAWKAWIERQCEFAPALNIEHRVERTGAFITLVLGYSILSLFYQSSVEFALTAFYGKAVLGLVQVFCLNIMYFEIDAFNLHIHAIRRHAISALTWMTAHVLLALSFTLSAAALAKLVLAHDSLDSDPHQLSIDGEAISQERLKNGQRWFYCGGLGIAVLAITLIRLTHRYIDRRTSSILEKLRLLIRVVVGCAIVFLGFASALSSLALIGTTATLIFSTTVVEIMTNIKQDSCSIFTFDKSFCPKYAVSRRLDPKELNGIHDEKVKEGQV